MCQVVAYRGLKTIENSKTVSQKSGRGRSQEVVIYQRFQYEALTQNNFGVSGRWSLMGGGCLQEVVARGGFDCRYYSKKQEIVTCSSDRPL